CTETRPLFQGRITARELSEAGIDTTITVDSAAKYAMEEFDIDAVLFGADAITSGGDLINKIGTSQIAQIASSAGIPVYSAAEIYKFDPATLWGGREGIEMRGREELLCGKEFKKVKAFNPAFDLTRAKFISAYITELGILPPQGISRALCKKFSIKNPI
ncbi:translation initiation factor IF-2B subunit delta, partial [Candidatus Micrarchaeota archaeon CG11_big_fil_rev_8_21_14_0_20_47_5]